MTGEPLRLTEGFAPGAIGRITELHGLYYCQTWNFARSFEAEVADGLSRFSGLYQQNRDGIWLVWQGGKVVASATLDASMADEPGNLRMRWVIADQAIAGKGIGRMLMDAMMAFADQRHLPVYLWTFDGLVAARRLYEKAGFVLTDERDFTNWGPPIAAQRMERVAR